VVRLQVLKTNHFAPFFHGRARLLSASARQLHTVTITRDAVRAGQRLAGVTVPSVEENTLLLDAVPFALPGRRRAELTVVGILAATFAANNLDWLPSAETGRRFDRCHGLGRYA
jgi:hypothetical protein